LEEKMKILFICKHNRFRSKVAEIIFNNLNKNPERTAHSAGLLLDKSHPYVEKKVLEILNKKGYDAKNSKPKQATRGFTEGFDLVVIVANDISSEFFRGIVPKVKRWNIKDCGKDEDNTIEKTMGKIETRVKSLINNL
jgi:protein-tyrosine-phosphatase